MVEQVLLAYIDEVNDEYYASYECDGGNDTIELKAEDLVPLPITPAELRQASIKVC